MDKLDKLDYALLDFMNVHSAITKMSAVTRKAILSELDINYNTLCRRLSKLISKGYANTGTPESREQTYYITEDGKKAFKEAINER